MARPKSNPYPAGSQEGLSWQHGIEAGKIEDCPFDKDDDKAMYSVWMAGWRASGKKVAKAYNIDSEALNYPEVPTLEKLLETVPKPVSVGLEAISTEELELELMKRKAEDLTNLLNKEKALTEQLSFVKTQISKLNILFGV